MLLTKECDYAVRILRALKSGELVNVAGISDREDISTQITYKLTRKLERSGLIESQRGVNGGYRLKASLEQITLLDVFKAVDQNMMVCDCSDGDHSCSRNTREHPCMVHLEFCRLQQLMQKELSEKSVLDVIEGK
ncbi:MAG: Rrf2 family transcriptional regulator [Lachnospiraceae bacterium]|nr:Rrf2 family transcriptional regulator [Lachnospiraceae bacterium]